MITLTISHNIYLTDEERINLANGKTIEVMGISVPVWFHEGNTSEPAREIFCKYNLENTFEDFPPTVLSSGYKFNLPQIPEGYKLPKRLKPEKIANMTKSEIDEWHIKNPMPATGLDLLNEENGGVKSIHFKKYSKNLEDNRVIRVVHIIDINPIEILESSILC